MEHKGQFNIKIILSVVVSLLLFIVVVLPLTTSSVNTLTATNTVTGESINATNGSTQTLSNSASNDLVAGSETISESGVDLVLNTNYTVDNSAMTVTFTDVNNTAFNASNATIGYQYRSESFESNANTRTILNTLPIFLAVGTLVLAGTFFFLRGR